MDTSIMVLSSLTFYTSIYMGLIYSMLKFCGLSREPSRIKDTSTNSRQYYDRSLRHFRADMNDSGMYDYQQAA